MQGAMYLLSSLIFGTLGASVTKYLFGKPRTTGKGAWSDAGDISGLTSGAPQQLTFESTRSDGWRVEEQKSSAWVILNHDGSVTAFAPLCTHLGCAYGWNSSRREFQCPCHGSTFSKEGKVLTGPASRPLDQYLVKVEGARLWLGQPETTSGS
jgi:menaquinol-cytochrome c reductase iron-sulfur subunit